MAQHQTVKIFHSFLLLICCLEQKNIYCKKILDQNSIYIGKYFTQVLILSKYSTTIVRLIWMDIFWVCEIVLQRCGQHTVTFSKSASEEVGDRGLMGLREGELPTLETYSGSGTYRTCKHNPCLYLHRHRLCANTHCTPHMHTQEEIKMYLLHTHTHNPNKSLTRQIT